MATQIKVTKATQIKPANGATLTSEQGAENVTVFLPLARITTSGQTCIWNKATPDHKTGNPHKDRWLNLRVTPTMRNLNASDAKPAQGGANVTLTRKQLLAYGFITD